MLYCLNQNKKSQSNLESEEGYKGNRNSW